VLNSSKNHHVYCERMAHRTTMDKTFTEAGGGLLELK
jgi:hypothetical protein